MEKAPIQILKLNVSKVTFENLERFIQSFCMFLDSLLTFCDSSHKTELTAKIIKTMFIKLPRTIFLFEYAVLEGTLPPNHTLVVQAMFANINVNDLFLE